MFCSRITKRMLVCKFGYSEVSRVYTKVEKTSRGCGVRETTEIVIRSSASRIVVYYLTSVIQGGYHNGRGNTEGRRYSSRLRATKRCGRNHQAIGLPWQTGSAFFLSERRYPGMYYTGMRIPR